MKQRKRPLINSERSEPIFINLAEFKYTNEKPYLCKIIHCGKEAYDSIYSLERDSCRGHVFIYTKKGSCLLKTNLGQWNLKKGDLVLISLKEWSYLYMKDGYWNSAFMCVYNGMIDNLYNRLKDLNSLIFHNFNPDEFESIIDDALDGYNNKNYDEIEMSVKLYRFFCHLEEKAPNTITNKKLETVLGYLEINFYKNINIDLIANLCGFSKYHLCRIFKEETNQTINEYLANIRLKFATKMLIETNESNDEIARQCGFGDVRNMYYVFKKTLNMTPRQYRIRYLGH